MPLVVVVFRGGLAVPERRTCGLPPDHEQVAKYFPMRQATV